eukprot:9572501-Alexandrium_andersonii.AAC.1
MCIRDRPPPRPRPQNSRGMIAEGWAGVTRKPALSCVSCELWPGLAKATGGICGGACESEPV